MSNENEWLEAVKEEDCSPQLLDKVLSFWFSKDPETMTSMKLFQTSIIAAQHPNLDTETIRFFVSGLLTQRWGTDYRSIREHVALLMLMHPSCPRDLLNYARTESDVEVVKETASSAYDALTCVSA